MVNFENDQDGQHEVADIATTTQTPVASIVKMNFEAIRRTVDEYCDKYPQILKYQITYDPIPDPEWFDYKDEPLMGKDWSNSSKRWRFIYKVIHTGLYYYDEGKKLKVTPAEIQDTYTKYFIWLAVLNDIELYRDFEMHVGTEARQVIKDEGDELESYHNLGLLQKLICPNKPLTILLKEISDQWSKVKETDWKLSDLMNSVRTRKITGVELDELLPALDDEKTRSEARLVYMMAMYKRRKESGIERKRSYLKNSFKSIELHDTNVLHPYFRPRTVSVLVFLVRLYCSWYNERFKAQIKESAKLARALHRKTKRLDVKPTTPQFKGKQAKMDVIKPLFADGIPIREIARLTGIPGSTVHRYVTELRAAA